MFFYRSASPRTLALLREFLPVPSEGLAREFAEGATPEDICARSLRALAERGVRHFYVSNLPLGRAHLVLDEILRKAGLTEAGADRAVPS